MSVQFDIKTLLISQAVVCLLFAAVMVLMARYYPYIAGLRQLSISFLATAVGISVFLMRSLFVFKIDILLSNGLYSVSNILKYVGIALLLGEQAPRLRWPVVLTVLSTIALACTLPGNDVALRIAIISVVDLLLRAFLIVILVRHFRGGAAVKLLALFAGFFMLSDLARVIATYHYGAPADVFRYNLTQSAYIAASMLTNCGVGIFSLALAVRAVASSLEQRAHLDALTGVLNRMGMESRLVSEVKRARRAGTPLSLAVLDIDDFKAFNSRGGHALGDEVLRQVATCMTANLRGSDACGRMGGDEFVLLFPGAPAADASVICRRILHAVEGLPESREIGKVPTLSLGLTEAHAQDAVETMLARADRALYAAKHTGKNCVVIELPGDVLTG